MQTNFCIPCGYHLIVTSQLLFMHWINIRARNETNIMPLLRCMVSERIHTRVHSDTFVANTVTGLWKQVVESIEILEMS